MLMLLLQEKVEWEKLNPNFLHANYMTGAINSGRSISILFKSQYLIYAFVKFIVRRFFFWLTAFN